MIGQIGWMFSKLAVDRRRLAVTIKNILVLKILSL